MSVVIQLLARFGMHHHALEPIDRQDITAPSQEHIVNIPIRHHFREAAIEAAVFTRFDGAVGLPKGQALLDISFVVFPHFCEITQGQASRPYQLC